MQTIHTFIHIKLQKIKTFLEHSDEYQLEEETVYLVYISQVTVHHCGMPRQEFREGTRKQDRSTGHGGMFFSGLLFWARLNLCYVLYFLFYVYMCIACT